MAESSYTITRCSSGAQILVGAVREEIAPILAHYPRTVYRFTPNFIRLVLPFAEGDDQATDQADALLQFCITPRSTKEMMQHLGLSHHPHFRNRLLLPLIASGKLALTIPDKPKSPKQRYIAVKPGVD